MKKEVDAIKHLYSEKAISLVLDKQSELESIHNAWAQAVADFIGEASEQGLYNLEKESFESFSLGESKLIVGLAGPGASGKDTISGRLGYPKAINVTTRKPRSYEEDGVHYFFVSEDQFGMKDRAGEFLTTSNKPNRGLYAIPRSELENKLADSSTVMVEESPEVLLTVDQEAKKMGHKFVLVYVLPPWPILPHVAARLANRCIEDGSDFGDVIASTLGIRQIEEFRSIARAREQGVPVLFIVNDDKDRATQKLSSALTTKGTA